MENRTNASQELPLLTCPTLDSTGAVASQIISYIVICFFALSGNLLVVANFLQKNSSERKLTDALITNIAISDLLVPLVIMSREFHDVVTRSPTWAVQGDIGELLCKLVSFLGDVASAVSIISLCVITIERFIIAVVADSFQNRRDSRSKRLNYLLVAICWIIPVVFNGHFFVTFELIYISPEIGSVCTGPVFDKNMYYYIYNVAVCVVFIFIPFSILTTLNIAIVLKLRQLFEKLGDNSTPEYRRRLKNLKKIKNMIICIILVFGMCWGPYCIILIVFTFYWNLQAPNTCLFHTVRFIAVLMTRANAAINPWVYLCFQRKPKMFLFRSMLQSFQLRNKPEVVQNGAAKKLFKFEDNFTDS